ncbi:MAG: hypothetical protein RMX35_33410 [Nostoc sp. DcaGUA01]|nr:hypothetical protein [Nostoc sp. DcaGUA01]
MTNSSGGSSINGSIGGDLNKTQGNENTVVKGDKNTVVEGNENKVDGSNIKNYITINTPINITLEKEIEDNKVTFRNKNYTYPEDSKEIHIKIKGNLNELNCDFLQKLVLLLHQFSQDPNLTIKTIKKGSIEITIITNAKGAYNLKEKFDSGELKQKYLTGDESDTNASNKTIDIEIIDVEIIDTEIIDTEIIEPIHIKIIKLLKTLVWPILIIVVIIPLIGKILITSSFTPPDPTSPTTDVINPQPNWNEIDELIIGAIKNARTTANNFAEAQLNDLVNGWMINVDSSFLDWYFNFFNQKLLEYNGAAIWLSSSIQNFIHSNTIPAKQILAEEITENLEVEFAKRVLKPKISELKLENIRTETIKIYVDQLGENLSSIQANSNISKVDWQRYTNDISITIYDGNGIASTSLRKVWLGLSYKTILKSSGAVGSKIGSKIIGKTVGNFAGQISAKSGAKIAGQIGSELLDPIIGIGIIVWDLWDYHNTVNIDRPILRDEIYQYLDEVKSSLLNNPENGIMASINDLETEIIKSVDVVTSNKKRSNQQKGSL